jgi:hypothetical protein
MARPCSVCAHASIGQIDEAILAGTSGRTIATKHNVSSAAIHRHRTNCVIRGLQKANQRRELVRVRKNQQTRTVLDRFEDLYEIAAGLLDRAASAGPTIEAARFIGQVRQTLVQIGHLTGQFPRAPEFPTMNVDNRTQIIALQNMGEPELRNYLERLRLNK